MNVGAWKSWLKERIAPAGTRYVAEATAPDSEQPLFITQDSRQFPNARSGHCAFVAIRGQWHDGHDYIAAAYAFGARFFIVESGTEVPAWGDADVVWAADVVQTWQDLVRHWRDACQTPVIAITGSNGKTTVKEWLVQLLSSHCDVYSSPRSYNSQVGVPLALGEISRHHALAIIEAGISQPGEMDRLRQCIGPNIGVLTHLGDAHLEHFESREALMREKLALFEGCDYVVMPDQLDAAKHTLEKGGMSVHTWGASADAALNVESNLLESGRTIRATWQDKSYAWHLPFADEMAYRNAMTAVLTALVWGLDPEWVSEALRNFKDLDHRMQRHRKSDGNWVLSDAYTNDWDALQLALSDLVRIPGNHRTAAIIGPVPGMRPGNGERLARLVGDAKVDQVWVVGSAWDEIPNRPGWQHYPSTEAVLDALQAERDAFEGAHVLVKGPRVERFERLVELLTEQGHATRMVLDLEALSHNLRALRQHIREFASHGAELLAVIKASGYGTHAPAIARVLQFHGVPLVAVACTEEGVELRKHGISMRILVLNPTANTFPALIAHRLEPAIHSLDQHRALLDALDQRNPSAAPWPIHLKIDTGMHRLGFDPSALPDVERVVQSEETHVKTVFSHLASADRPEHDALTRSQIHRFESVVEALRTQQSDLKTHILNTAGCVRFPESAGDFVRIGIGLMGIQPVPEGQNEKSPLALKPVVRFETSVSSLHRVPAHEGVGYGLEDAAAHDRLLATLPVGYADGFPRNLSNRRGAVIIRGQHARVVGKVCMDMVMVDVTEIEGVKAGDSVEIFGLQQSIEDFAAAADTIPYEILTRIPGRVAREQRGN